MKMSFCDSEKLGLYANSKKIKKVSRAQFKEYSPSSEDDDDVVTKKYTTYTKSQKTAMVEDLKRTLESYFEVKSDSTNELIDHLDTLHKLEYNEIIEKILAIHAPSSLKSKRNKAKWQQDLKRWRRQLKAWLKSDAKPEKRANIRVVSSEKTDEFKLRITAILKTMTTRSFELLRSQAIDALEEMHNNRNPDQPFNRKTFSKHFWYDFKRAHPEIDELYESIPISRSNGKKSPKTETTSPNNTAKNDDFEEEFSTGLSGECGTLSPYYHSVESELDSLNEKTQSYWLDSSSIEQILSVPIETSELSSFDLDNWSEEEKASKYDFYQDRKMIVETEDNEFQRKLFRCFYNNGI